MDRFQELRSFVTVVEAGSFVRAADVLRTSKAAVSKSVLKLEARLGVRVLHRTTRRQSLTEEGRAYFERAKQILDALDEADATVGASGSAPVGVLRITAPLTYGLVRLAPLWGDFIARHPAVKLEISLADRVVDIVEEGFDVAVRIGRLADSRLVTRKLATARMVMCAAPAYLERNGVPATLKDVARHPVLAYDYLATGDTWIFDHDGTAHEVTTHPILRSNNGDTCRAAALDGRGIVLQPTFLVGDDLARGALLEILPQFRGAELGIYAVYPSRRQLSPKVRALVDFLAERLADDAAPPRPARRPALPRGRRGRAS